MNRLSDSFKKKLLFNLIILILVIPCIFVINFYGKNVEVSTVTYLKDNNKVVMPVSQKDTQEASNKVKDVTDSSIQLENKESLLDYDVKEDSIKYIEENQENMIDGIILNVDGNSIYVKDESVVEEAKNLLYTLLIRDDAVLKNFKETNLLEGYKIDNKNISNINIENEVSLSEGKVPESKTIKTGDDLLFVLFHKDLFIDKKETYEVKSGETFEDVLKNTGLSKKEFYVNNPKYSTVPLFKKGDKIVLNKIDPLLKVAIYFSEEKTEKLTYDTIRKEDDELPYGDEEVTQEGENGSQKVTYNTKMVNGKVEYKKASKYELIKNPVNKVINVGTKKPEFSGSNWSPGSLTPSTATGGFIWPSDFRNMTCGIGCYAGHTGADIATNHYGSSIYASKSGTVTHAGWDNGGCGYSVSINHGGGIVTNYCHMKQQPNVSVGQTVSQGQVIGYEGATGNVTAPHIHFEIRLGASSMYSGTPVDPLPYLS